MYTDNSTDTRGCSRTETNTKKNFYRRIGEEKTKESGNVLPQKKFEERVTGAPKDNSNDAGRGPKQGSQITWRTKKKKKGTAKKN